MSEEQSRIDQNQDQQPEEPKVEHQQETTENSETTVNTQVQPETQQTSAEQTSAGEIQQKPSLTIETNPDEPTSPRRQPRDENIGNVLLSPKADNSQRLISQQSPSVLKTKLDVLKKLYNNHLDQYNAMNEAERTFGEKKQQVESLRASLADAQKHESQKANEAAHIVPQKHQTIVELQQRLQNLKSVNIGALHTERVNHLNSQIATASQRLVDRENQVRNEQINHKIQQKVSELSQRVAQLSQKKSETQNILNQNRDKVNSTRSTIDSLFAKLNTAGGNNSERLHQLEQQRQNVEKQIESRRQQINKLRSEIQSPKTGQDTVDLPDLAPLKNSVEEAKKTKAQLDKEIETTHKQLKELAHKIKSNESAIDSKKSKNSHLNDKSKKLEEEKSHLEKDVNEFKKKPKFEEKVPQELVQLRTKKAALQKQAKEQTQKVEKQRSKDDDLVPASVIENMKGRIARVHQQNDRYSKLLVQNAALVEDNKALDASKEELEWETNPEIKNVQTNKQKEESKFSALEEEVSELRKKNIQVNNKLEEYTTEYPEFRPKMKKAEPAPQQPQPTKAQKQTPVDTKTNNKKKNKSNQQIPQVAVVEEEEEKPVPVVQKAAGKKQEQKGGKNKNKSPKGKEQQIEAPRKEEAPAPKKEQKKQEVPKKVEAPKEAPKKEEPKKEELKIGSKVSQAEKTQQGNTTSNKNKKKR